MAAHNLGNSPNYCMPSSLNYTVTANLPAIPYPFPRHFPKIKSIHPLLRTIHARARHTNVFALSHRDFRP